MNTASVIKSNKCQESDFCCSFPRKKKQPYNMKCTFCLLFFFFFFNFGLLWVFAAECGLSLVAATGATVHCGARVSHCGGFSCCGARALGARTSVVVARRLSCCGAQA